MLTRRSKYIYQIPTEIDEQMCVLGVIYFEHVGRNFSVRDSDVDYYGFTDVTFDVLHSDGSFWPEMDERVHLDRGLRAALDHEITERLV
jgi:hypothetical protein